MEDVTKYLSPVAFMAQQLIISFVGQTKVVVCSHQTEFTVSALTLRVKSDPTPTQIPIAQRRLL